MTNDRMQDTARCVTELRDLFIRHERFAPLEHRFTLLSAKRLADIETGRTSEARGIALSGASGAGKSAAIEHLITRARKRLEAEGHGEMTIVSLRVPSPATLKFVGQELLRALGYQIGAERQAWYIWDLVRHHLRERRVLFVHLDEAQDLACRGTRHELNAVASMLKTLMTDGEWPVGLILSGTEDLEDILNHDPQLARRMNTIHFESLSPIADGENATDLLANYCARGKLTPVEELLTRAHGERLVHAAANQFGLVIELILEAMERAYLAGAASLTAVHFAESYQQRAACGDAFNPFIIPDFYRIDPRQVFTRRPD
ncbi:TniB family NTP-binding protein [Paenirhodobacter sp. CAU 1674]|uniref:TniB family NTP-binding protein n=1 Tax=Paenirhodobacter sp. CAU 1674 TaxID=3032596 RepID=UPI0023D98C24|nr:TniB family NTP-binding protein [Paenirhodobacter sp. CAU 1674]MDF2143281.1 TniB family NTP-binding protein [Paenirhodobacter sp. CAU 1674]